MLRLVLLAVIVIIGCKALTGRYPWEYLAAQTTRKQAVERARKLLAVRNGASRGEILDAHKRLIAVVHPDRGGNNSQVHEANAARDLLLAELPENSEK